MFCVFFQWKFTNRGLYNQFQAKTAPKSPFSSWKQQTFSLFLDTNWLLHFTMNQTTHRKKLPTDVLLDFMAFIPSVSNYIWAKSQQCVFPYGFGLFQDRGGWEMEVLEFLRKYVSSFGMFETLAASILQLEQIFKIDLSSFCEC